MVIQPHRNSAAAKQYISITFHSRNYYSSQKTTEFDQLTCMYGPFLKLKQM